jgi:hypothetical protein
MDDWEGVQVPELSRLTRDRQGVGGETLAFHATDGCSNGSTEASIC